MTRNRDSRTNSKAICSLAASGDRVDQATRGAATRNEHDGSRAGRVTTLAAGGAVGGLILAGSLAACGARMAPTTCGAGTEYRDGECVVTQAASDGSAADAPQVDAGRGEADVAPPDAERDVRTALPADPCLDDNLFLHYQNCSPDCQVPSVNTFLCDSLRCDGPGSAAPVTPNSIQVLRTPDLPGQSPGAASCGTDHFAYAMMVVAQSTGSPYDITVPAPYEIYEAPSTVRTCCPPATPSKGHCYHHDNRTTVALLIATRDPNAPARNIRFDSSCQ